MKRKLPILGAIAYVLTVGFILLFSFLSYLDYIEMGFSSDQQENSMLARANLK